MTGSNQGVIVFGGSVSAGQMAVGPGARAQSVQAGDGAVINVDANLVSVSQGAAVARQELGTLLESLRAALNVAPSDAADAADAVSTQAGQLVEAANKDKPNRTMLQVLASGLGQAAAFLKETVPDAVTIVTQIVGLVGRLHGISL